MPVKTACIDFLSLELHKSLLVVADHLTHYAQAFPTPSKKKATATRALFDNFFIHRWFPGKLHSDWGANFKSKIIQGFVSYQVLSRDEPPRMNQSDGQWHVWEVQ